MSIEAMIAGGVSVAIAGAYACLSSEEEDTIDRALTNTVHNQMKTIFYCGYRVFPEEIVNERNEELVKDFGAVDVDCVNNVDAPVKVKYIASKAANRTGNVVIVCLNTTYEDHRSRHWEPFLKNGADVVLWNPTDSLPKQYEEDLLAVIQRLRQDNPNQVMALKTYCASSDPAIGAAERAGGAVHLIIDRGHGDTFSLARSHTIVAIWSLVKRVIRQSFDCHGIEKIAKIAGKSLFMIPKDDRDQLMEFKGRNFTKELADQVVDDQKTVEYIPGDHWTNWGVTAYTKALNFLMTVGVVKSAEVDAEAYPDPQPPGFFKRLCVPFLAKSWF